MKHLLFLLMAVAPLLALAQDVPSLMDDGKKLEQKYKEEDAILKYRQAAQIDPENIKVQVKLAELSCSIGARQVNREIKARYFSEAKKHADMALRINADDAEANYITAVVFGKLTETEVKKDLVVNDVKQIKDYADKALSINPKMGKAWFVLGKWHFELLTLNPVKKAAIKLLFGSMPEASIETAIQALEKGKLYEPYYCLGFFDLAKAYEFNRQYEKAISTLEQLAKLPGRRQDDVAIKTEGAALLQKLQ